jgi:hypothetical protein
MKFAFAQNAVKDLRPLRGANASLTASSLRLSFYYGAADAAPFLSTSVSPMSGNMYDLCLGTIQSQEGPTVIQN